MKLNRLALAAAAAALTASTLGIAADRSAAGSVNIKHVLLLSIDGMHAVDFYNCANGIAGVNGGQPYCPNLAALSPTAINFVNVTSSRPSDSFPGLTALITGGTRRAPAFTTTSHMTGPSMRQQKPPAVAWGKVLAHPMLHRPGPRPILTKASTSTI